MLCDGEYANLTLLNKYYSMKKNIYLVKNTSFTICMARPTLMKNFMLWKRKKASQEKPLKCFSGPEFFKIGQFFYFDFSYPENLATFVVLIPL